MLLMYFDLPSTDPQIDPHFKFKFFQINVFCVVVIIFWNYAIRPQMTSRFCMILSISVVAFEISENRSKVWPCNR